MKLWLGLGIGLLLTACSLPSANDGLDEDPVSVIDQVGDVEELILENLGPAPELENEVWLNVDAPLRLANLRGKVVLLDMWTFG
jgi:hypothetical protein